MLPLVEDWAPCPGCDAAADGASIRARALHVVANSRRLVRSPFLALIGCEVCGLAYVTPRPDPAALTRYYDRGVQGGWAREQPIEGSEKLRRKHAVAERALAPILDAVPEPGRVLDYGCGAGVMLDVLQAHGWRTVGLEPGHLATYAARRHELVASVPETPTYHAVIVHHVLEHVLYPGALLRQLHAAALPDSWIVVGVPSLDDLAVTGGLNYVCSARHINAFTRDALANVLRLSGWQPVASDRRRQSRSRPRAASTDQGADPRRMVMHAVRVDAALVPHPGAVRSAARALKQYGRRLDARGEFNVCPLTPPGG